MREPGSQAVLAAGVGGRQVAGEGGRLLAGVGGRQLVGDSLVAEAVGSSEIGKQK